MGCVACQHGDSHPRQFCRGNAQFSLKSWKQSPVQLPNPWFNVQLSNASVILKIQRIKWYSVHIHGGHGGRAAQPLWDPRGQPWTGSPCSLWGCRKEWEGNRTTCFTVSQDYWSCSSCLNSFHLSDHWCNLNFAFPCGTFGHMEKLMMMKLSQSREHFFFVFLSLYPN